MNSRVLMVASASIFLVTFVAWWYLNALACGMIPTGCLGFTLGWGDWDALQFFVPMFIVGGAVVLFGLWGALRKR